MKENPYDNRQFFDKYGQMYRSKYGLKGAGEWRDFQRILPDFAGKRVLDLGCGYGWHSRYAVEKGAEQVLGVDISQRMLKVASQKNSHEKINYICQAMEDLSFADQTFDIVFSSLAFHYVRDLRPLIQNISSWLVQEGHFVFSVEHPVFTAYGSQDWYYDEEGEIAHFPVDNYFIEGKRDAIFLGEHVVKYHRTLTTYLEMLIQCGFAIKHVVEPQPPVEMMDLPGMRDELRRPMMLLIAAQKNERDI